MAHSYHSDTYNLISEEPKSGTRKGKWFCEWPKAEWIIFNNNDSSPNSPVTIVLHKVDGNVLTLDDPRRVEIQLPFGLLAEYVGYRVCCDRIGALEQMNPRQVLVDMGLAHQGLASDKAE